MSEQMMTQTKPKSIHAMLTPISHSVLQRCSNGVECAECRKKREASLQRVAVTSAPAHGVPSIVHDVLRSPGQSLDTGTRAFMEPRFGRDFSHVRIHTDAQAAQSAQVVNAQAYTVGQDLVFGPGQYAPETQEGTKLLAHELVSGALIGNAATTKERPLTSDEKSYAKEIFQDSIDYSRITITRDSLFAAGAPRTIGNTIHLKSSSPWDHFKGDTMELTEKGKLALIHEMGHVWQYQNGGLAYIPESLWAQFKAAIGSGSRGAAYDWRQAHQSGLPWEKWNPEQQAGAIEDYNKALRRSKDGTATLEDFHDLSTLKPYMEKVRARQGAPSFGSAPDPRKAGL